MAAVVETFRLSADPRMGMLTAVTAGPDQHEESPEDSSPRHAGNRKMTNMNRIRHRDIDLISALSDDGFCYG